MQKKLLALAVLVGFLAGCQGNQADQKAATDQSVSQPAEVTKPVDNAAVSAPATNETKPAEVAPAPAPAPAEAAPAPAPMAPSTSDASKPADVAAPAPAEPAAPAPVEAPKQ